MCDGESLVVLPSIMCYMCFTPMKLFLAERARYASRSDMSRIRWLSFFLFSQKKGKKTFELSILFIFLRKKLVDPLSNKLKKLFFYYVFLVRLKAIILAVTFKQSVIIKMQSPSSATGLEIWIQKKDRQQIHIFVTKWYLFASFSNYSESVW